MSKWREFWPSESEIERLNLDGKPHKNDGYYVHLIERAALDEAQTEIAELKEDLEIAKSLLTVEMRKSGKLEAKLAVAVEAHEKNANEEVLNDERIN